MISRKEEWKFFSSYHHMVIKRKKERCPFKSDSALMPLIEPSIFCNISGSKAGSECGLTLNCTVLLLLFAYKLNNFASAFEIFPVEFHFPSPSQLPGATWSYTCNTLSCKEQQWATLSNTELSYTELSCTELHEATMSWAELHWATLNWVMRLHGATLSYTELSNTELSYTELHWAE